MTCEEDLETYRSLYAHPDRDDASDTAGAFPSQLSGCLLCEGRQLL